MTETPNPKPALWLRIAQFPLTRLILLGGALFYMMGLSNGFMDKFSKTPLLSLAAAAAMAALALAVYFAFARFIERRPVGELGLRGLGWELGAGLLIVSLLYTACVSILIVLGV